jgi:hypothetical protein
VARALRLIAHFPIGEFTTQNIVEMRERIENFARYESNILFLPSGVDIEIVGMHPEPPVEGQQLRKVCDQLQELGWRPDHPVMQWLNYCALRREFAERNEQPQIEAGPYPVDLGDLPWQPVLWDDMHWTLTKENRIFWMANHEGRMYVAAANTNPIIESDGGSAPVYEIVDNEPMGLGNLLWWLELPEHPEAP